jgi:hypothetical protein
MPIVVRVLDEKPMRHPQFAMGVRAGYFLDGDPSKLECAVYREGAIIGMELWERLIALSESEREELVRRLRSSHRSLWEKPPHVEMEGLEAAYHSIAPCAVSWPVIMVGESKGLKQAH